MSYLTWSRDAPFQPSGARQTSAIAKVVRAAAAVLTAHAVLATGAAETVSTCSESCSDSTAHLKCEGGLPNVSGVRGFAMLQHSANRGHIRIAAPEAPANATKANATAPAASANTTKAGANATDAAAANATKTAPANASTAAAAQTTGVPVAQTTPVPAAPASNESEAEPTDPPPINAAEPRLCEKGGAGNFVPFFKSEPLWPHWLRTAFYFFLLAWLFLGISIISDTFMNAIETITAKKVRILGNDGRQQTVKIWNDTVANLTLLALGSSTPEILLSCVELVSRRFYAGELGPSTIVGSAAFNLFIIPAVCVIAIPDGQVRRIKDVSGFAVTAVWSILAYVWVCFILSWSSPNVVEIWEGVVTFVCFPILVIMAYAAGKMSLRGGKVKGADLSREELAALVRNLKTTHGKNIGAERLAQLVEEETVDVSRAINRRRQACRALTGGRKVGGAASSGEASGVVYVGLEPGICVAKKGKTQAKLRVVRRGPTEGAVTVSLRTLPNSAKPGVHFVALDSSVTLLPGEASKELAVQLLENTDPTSDARVLVEVVDVKVDAPSKDLEAVVSPELAMSEIRIVDDSGPGVIEFEQESVIVREDQGQDTTLTLRVLRLVGCAGQVSCSYATEDISAVSGNDYLAASGEVTFRAGELEAFIRVVVKPKDRWDDVREDFRVILSEPQGGATFDTKTDGTDDIDICTVTILAADEHRQEMERVKNVLKFNWDRTSLGSQSWRQQFVEAMYVNGSPEEQADAGALDWFLHVLSLPFKLFFALLPPPIIFDGWLCFFLALAVIGVLTAVVGDVASMASCLIGIPDSIAAITLVAIGTSLPDTFASMSASRQDPYADNAIGNVTGSNSVNVFLGLGLPWMAGAIYWHKVGATEEWKRRIGTHSQDVLARYPNGAFVVMAGDLGFSVMVYCICAVTAVGILVWRRSACGGELGGRSASKQLSALALGSLWVVYIGLSIWKTMASGEH